MLLVDLERIETRTGEIRGNNFAGGVLLDPGFLGCLIGELVSRGMGL